MKLPGRRGLFKRFVNFLKEARAELKKVVWPTRKETVAFTSVVIVSVIIVAVAVWAIDSVFSQVLKLILR